MRIVLFVSLLIIFLSQTNQKAFAKEDTATHSKQAQKTTSKSKLPDSAKVICYSNVSNALELPNDARAFEGNNITLGLVEDDLPLNGYSKDDLNNGLKVYFKRPGSAFFEVYTHSAVGAFVASENEEYSYSLKNINFDKTNDMLSYQIVKKIRGERYIYDDNNDVVGSSKFFGKSGYTVLIDTYAHAILFEITSSYDNPGQSYTCDIKDEHYICTNGTDIHLNIHRRGFYKVEFSFYRPDSLYSICRLFK